PKPKPRPKLTPVRKTLIPRDCYLTVSNPKIAEISTELRSLQLAAFPHAISVLFRVFLEQSVDHYLSANGISLVIMTKAGRKDKSLRVKLNDTTDHMGNPKKNLDGVVKGIGDSQSSLYVDTFHNYVHN